MIQKLTETESFARFLCVFTNRFPDLTIAAVRSNDPVRYFLDNTSNFLSEKGQGVAILIKCACKFKLCNVYNEEKKAITHAKNYQKILFSSPKLTALLSIHGARKTLYTRLLVLLNFSIILYVL